MLKKSKRIGSVIMPSGSSYSVPKFMIDTGLDNLYTNDYFDVNKKRKGRIGLVLRGSYNVEKSVIYDMLLSK